MNSTMRHGGRIWWRLVKIVALEAGLRPRSIAVWSIAAAGGGAVLGAIVLRAAEQYGFSTVDDIILARRYGQIILIIAVAVALHTVAGAIAGHQGGWLGPLFARWRCRREYIFAAFVTPVALGSAFLAWALLGFQVVIADGSPNLTEWFTSVGMGILVIAAFTAFGSIVCVLAGSASRAHVLFFVLILVPLLVFAMATTELVVWGVPMRTRVVLLSHLPPTSGWGGLAPAYSLVAYTATVGSLAVALGVKRLGRVR